MPSSSVSKFPTGRPWRIKPRDRESLHRVEQIGSANPPLAVHCLHDDRRRQFRLYGISESSQLDSLFAIASSLLNVAHRSLHVRVAVCRQVARAPNRPIGTNTMVNQGEEERRLDEKASPFNLSMRELESDGMKAI